ncbi:F0F1 ATP synthase subunit A [Candidatus Binatus sp.]|uniref:F0F1 ATP synthase subunit A n=1 Tax=Candidatus Binatus sp. TaxID=2811406 RepID=UPI002F93F12F
MQQSINFLEMIGGGKIPEVLVGTWLVMGILLIFAFLARRSLAAAADPIVSDDKITLHSVAETIVEWVDSSVSEVTQIHHYRGLVPFFGTLFMFILLANFLGLVPGMEPPTADSDLTFALGTICFAFYIYQGMKAQGVVRYLRTFLGPMIAVAPLMLVIEIADNLFRPFSLGVRLYANMFADHMVLSIFTGLTKLLVPLAFLTLGSIVCVIQAMVFMILSMAYVRLAVSHEH